MNPLVSIPTPQGSIDVGDRSVPDGRRPQAVVLSIAASEAEVPAQGAQRLRVDAVEVGEKARVVEVTRSGSCACWAE